LLRRYDPDILLTTWGDSWLLPALLVLSEEHNISLPLNRETGMDVLARAARSYFAYGQVIYRGPKMLLFGRWHIDIANTVMYHDYGLPGVIEMARITGLPAQTAARVSPGTGISAMQIRTALNWRVLVPWRKQQVERPKSARMLLHTDKGGMVYQPIIGLHKDVVEIDFTSMYPAIMVYFNLSPETVGAYGKTSLPVPELGLAVDRQRVGLVPETLRPLLEKRIKLKAQLLEMDPRDCRYARYKAWAAAYKWLLVVCFGYLGYKNARFGRIEAHEAVTAYGREALLRAKEAAEDLGYTVLHMYVDGLWVQKDGVGGVPAAQPLMDEVFERTGLPVALDGIYKWVAFLPSRMDPRVPVANRYFGVFQSGGIKVRGIEARRRDTPPFIKKLQLALIAEMGNADPGDLAACLPRSVRQIQEEVAKLRNGSIPLEALLVTQTLSRELGDYKVPSPVARATQQLENEGKGARPGQAVRFLYTRGRPGVFAWDRQERPDPKIVDVARYITLLLRAAHTVLQPLGVAEETLRLWVLGDAGYGARPGYLVGTRPDLLTIERPVFRP
jgi:DNA polymerase-2